MPFTSQPVIFEIISKVLENQSGEIAEQMGQTIGHRRRPPNVLGVIDPPDLQGSGLRGEVKHTAVRRRPVGGHVSLATSTNEKMLGLFGLKQASGGEPFRHSTQVVGRQYFSLFT